MSVFYLDINKIQNCVKIGVLIVSYFVICVLTQGLEMPGSCCVDQAYPESLIFLAECWDSACTAMPSTTVQLSSELVQTHSFTKSYQKGLLDHSIASSYYMTPS